MPMPMPMRLRRATVHGMLFHLLVLAVLVTTTSQCWADDSLEFEGEILGLSSGPSSRFVMVLNQQGQLLRWNSDGTTAVLLENIENESKLSEIASIEWRGEYVTAFGDDENGKFGMATFQLKKDGRKYTPKYLEGKLSETLDFVGDQDILSTTSTSIGVYFLLKAANDRSLWFLGLHTASKDDPKRLYHDEADIGAFAISPSGYLTAAVSESDSVSLHFHHAKSGKLLIEVPTDMSQISALTYLADGRLFAAGKKGDVEGLFRIDAANEGLQRRSKGTKVFDLSGVTKLDAFSTKIVAQVGRSAKMIDFAPEDADTDESN